MSNLESKLEEFRRRAEEAAKKLAGQTGKAGEKAQPEPEAKSQPAEPAVKAEPVAARIGSQLGEVTGPVSHVDRSSVLASPRPELSEPIIPAPQAAQADVDIPEVEDYLPWLKEDEGTGEPKSAEETAVSDSAPAPHVQSPASPAQEEKPAAYRPNISGVTPPAASTPREFKPETSVPSRDTVLSFEGTGQPRPVEKLPRKSVEDKTEAKQETNPAPSP